MHTELLKGIEHAYAVRANPIVFALTGRTGSGCSTAALSLASQISEIALSEEDFQQPERRKMSIILDYARASWVPFSIVTVSSVIYSFLLHEDDGAVTQFLEDKEIAKKGRDEVNQHLSALKENPSFSAFERAMKERTGAEEMAAAWDYFNAAVSPRANQSRRVLSGQYPSLFQSFGDNIRFSGRALNSSIQSDRLFVLMDRVRRLVECAHEYRQSVGENQVRVVIDAIRNPLEMVYLRKHLANLYVVAITADDGERRGRLSESGLGKREIDAIDAKEYDGKKHLSDYASFVSQNLKDCIQKSDIFVANPGMPGQFASSVKWMNAQLVRYVSLALRPGIVTPTRDERCMQIAFVAKLNSGCISRQVGAVVADADHSVCAIGWNDTPKGQTSCLLRDVGSLLTGGDSDSFSDYEKTDQRFRTHLEKKFGSRTNVKEENGLRCPFCFKDAYNQVDGKQNQVHTRSLHAEENAFLQLAKRGSSGISGGVLFTTASPCELCSKKAYQLGLSEIVYVDPYPGISTTHVLRSGPDKFRPQLRLFSGSVGHAYHRLYEALLSIKDEYGVRLAASEVTARERANPQQDPNLALWK